MSGRGRRALALPCLALLTATLAACRDTPTPFAVKEALSRQMPGARFELETHVRLGRIALGASRRILAWVGESAAEAHDVVSLLRYVEVATYTVDSLPPDQALRRLRLSAAARLEDRGWRSVVRAADEGEHVWVLQRSDPEGGLSHLFIVALDGDELTLVSIEGRIEQLVAEEISGEPGAFARWLPL